MRTIPERDWKYLRSCKEDLLNTLCERIGDQATAILNSQDLSPHERYQQLYDHVGESDRIVAACFDGWKRSAIAIRLSALDCHGLLTPEHLDHLSDQTKEIIHDLREIRAL